MNKIIRVNKNGVQLLQKSTHYCIGTPNKDESSPIVFNVKHVGTKEYITALWRKRYK